MPAEFHQKGARVVLVLLTFVLVSRAGAQLTASVGLAPAGTPVQEAVPGLFLGGILSTAYDSNVTQLPQGAGAQGSSIDSATLLAIYDHTYERQHISASADVGRIIYRQYDLYNYTAEDLRGELKSSFASDVNTDISIARSQRLAQEEYLNTIRRNLIATDTAKAAIYLPVAAEWHAVVAGNGTELRNSNPIDQPTNLDTTEGDLGARYQTGAQNYIDVLLRGAHSTYPNGSLSGYEDASFNDRGADLRVNWRFAGSSQILGHVGYTVRRYPNLPILDFSGPAYELLYTLAPGYKTLLTLYGLRQAGSVGDSGYLAGVTHTYRFTPAYLPTEKVRLEAYYQWSGFDYYANIQALAPDQPLSVASTNRYDTDSSYGLAATWNPFRWLMLKLEAHREQRSSNISTFDFSEQVTRLSAQAKF